ncbi:MAG TPA: lipoyl(octanoyl) transferase LipB [Candidatus Hydrogenedentes bacterium]|nr:lipoyl(octanoyl) transferase LipB [Candidatus Hydrogenedentota bacterium]HRZ16232.1 lipoyl(octanoyl) transferase LipB [Candidatus Hydrogenedentota bacterium]
MRPRISFERLPGLVSYGDAFEMQRARRAAVECGETPDTVFLLEHAPVITLGRKADAAHVLAPPEKLKDLGVALVPSDRGGDVTYHGPGQMVAYPVLDLRRRRCSVQWYLRSLEEALIRLLADYGITADRLEGHTGVWVGNEKIAAVGVGIRQWVTFHGVALNVAPDWGHWSLIVPCGIRDRGLTSMARLLGHAPPMTEVMDRFERAFLDVFSENAGTPAGKGKEWTHGG